MLHNHNAKPPTNRTQILKMFKHLIKLGRFNFSIASWMTSKVRTTGIYDWVEGGKHVLFMDYDKIRYKWLIQELKRLQQENKLSDIYIIQSSEKSYHAICCDEMHAIEAQQIILQTNCDESFKKAMYYDYCSRVLRTFPKGHTSKPKYLLTLKSKHNQRKKSLAHIKFLQLNYDIPNMNFENNNGNEKIWLIDYPTKKNIEPSTHTKTSTTSP